MATTFNYITVKNRHNKCATHAGGEDSLLVGLARFALVHLDFVATFFLFGHLFIVALVPLGLLAYFFVGLFLAGFTGLRGGVCLLGS